MPANPLFKELRTHLTALYPDPADARRVVDDAGVTQAQIDFSGKALNNWHAILTEAEKQGQLAAIIEVALEEYPQHTALARLYTTLDGAQSQTGAVEPRLKQPSQGSTTVNTGGGAYIAGNVNTGGGDFVGRNKRG